MTSSGQEWQFLVECIYIYESDRPNCYQAEMACIPLHFIYIYIYRKEMNPPGQSSIEALHTVTLYIYIYIYIYRKEMNPLVNQV